MPSKKRESKKFVDLPPRPGVPDHDAPHFVRAELHERIKAAVNRAFVRGMPMREIAPVVEMALQDIGMDARVVSLRHGK